MREWEQKLRVVRLEGLIRTSQSYYFLTVTNTVNVNRLTALNFCSRSYLKKKKVLAKFQLSLAIAGIFTLQIQDFSKWEIKELGILSDKSIVLAHKMKNSFFLLLLRPTAPAAVISRDVKSLRMFIKWTLAHGNWYCMMNSQAILR